jgi:hypothetical protein
MAIDGHVSVLGGTDPIADVVVTVFGPMEGKAIAALKSFPLMAAEISEALSIPQVTATSDAGGRFRVAVPGPGVYSVLARRMGYLGPATPGDAPTSTMVTATVTVGGKERAEVLLYMVPGEPKPIPKRLPPQ